MSEFKGTQGKWVIVTKGNTVQQLAIENDRGEKVCGNISPKRTSDAKLISKAPEMLEMLQKCSKYLSLIPNDLQSEENAESIDQLIKEATES